MTRTLLLLLSLPLAACSSTVPATLVGAWGGPHLGMVVTAEGAQLEYDCAHGRIDGELRPDRDGEFVALGAHVQEHGGPIRVDEPVVERPARYFGRVSGGALTLRVELTDDGTSLGTYQLQRGATPNILKCL